jgi:hypothetical protein
MNGNRLLETCESANSEDKGYCAGYVAAAMDANNTFLNSMAAEKKTPLPPIYCVPEDGIEIGQAVRITVKWMREHPEKLHIEGDILVWQSLRDSFPCKRENAFEK